MMWHEIKPNQREKLRHVWAPVLLIRMNYRLCASIKIWFLPSTSPYPLAFEPVNLDGCVGILWLRNFPFGRIHFAWTLPI